MSDIDKYLIGITTVSIPLFLALVMSRFLEAHECDCEKECRSLYFMDVAFFVISIAAFTRNVLNSETANYWLSVAWTVAATVAFVRVIDETRALVKFKVRKRPEREGTYT